jgi:ribonuclease HII
MRYVVGIDEVGRGSLAGPVMVAVVCMPAGYRLKTKIPLRDSKKLTPDMRELWKKEIGKDKKIEVAYGAVSPRVIDRMNISQAANQAAYRAWKRIEMKIGERKYEIILDGGLFLKNKTEQRRYPARTVVKADECFPVVSLASIMAKVRRDALMTRMDKKHPGYGFGIHKGYGTLLHRRAMKRKGPSPIHRLTFLH